MKFYSLDKILETKADYFIIYGVRSNGKTFACENYGLKDYCENKNQMAIIRRWEEDVKGTKGAVMFDALVSNGLVEKYTKGKYNDILYQSRCWYLCKRNELGEKLYQDEEPFCFAFAISSEEHYKSTSYPNIKNILFDEFISRNMYLPDEFIKFQNLLSTIIRQKNDVKIFMCGNTINKYCPYFNEMGLYKIKTQQEGSIDIYTYGDSELKVAVEYCYDSGGKTKSSNKYYAFNNPKLDMITMGGWEMNIYPHLPYKYNKSNIRYIYFILFDDELLQCEIIRLNDVIFTYIHRKTTPIKEDNKSIIFQCEPRAERNYRRKINKIYDDYGKKIWSFFITDKVFYQDNEVGEIVRNYIIWCKKEGI